MVQIYMEKYGRVEGVERQRGRHRDAMTEAEVRNLVHTMFGYDTRTKE